MRAPTSRLGLRISHDSARRVRPRRIFYGNYEEIEVLGNIQRKHTEDEYVTQRTRHKTMMKGVQSNTSRKEEEFK